MIVIMPLPKPVKTAAATALTISPQRGPFDAKAAGIKQLGARQQEVVGMCGKSLMGSGI